MLRRCRQSRLRVRSQWVPRPGPGPPGRGPGLGVRRSSAPDAAPVGLRLSLVTVSDRQTESRRPATVTVCRVSERNSVFWPRSESVGTRPGLVTAAPFTAPRARPTRRSHRWHRGACPGPAPGPPDPPEPRQSLSDWHNCVTRGWAGRRPGGATVARRLGSVRALPLWPDGVTTAGPGPDPGRAAGEPLPGTWNAPVRVTMARPSRSLNREPSSRRGRSGNL